jgi:hypothetical protein
VNEITKKPTPTQSDCCLSADDLNTHYEKMSTDSNYEAPLHKQTAATDQSFTNEISIFNILDRLHHTADGADALPAWFLRLTAPVYCGVLANLINRSLASLHVPTQWKTAIIHPVAKVNCPSSPADFRPISVTPVLSRVVEREIVHRYIYPTFVQLPMSKKLEDQYAFRPTGSTTAALIAILQHVTTMLKTTPM